MVQNPNPTRRTVVKGLAGTGLATSAVGSASGAGSDRSGGDDDALTLVAAAGVENAMEVVADDEYAYVATGRGMAIVDWEDPNEPDVVADIEASDPEAIGGDDRGATGGVLDVKVDDDLAIMAHDDGTGITTVDVSDPSDPEELAFYHTLDAVGVHNAFLTDETVYMTISGDRMIQDDAGVGVRIFGNAGVEIVDVENPRRPERAATWYLHEALPDYADAGINPNHDLYVQDGLLYNAFWDAGVVVLDVDDPADPSFVTQFGAAPDGDEELRPWRPREESRSEFFDAAFPSDRYSAGEGNTHYVQPSPDGEYVYVGDEKFPGQVQENPPTEAFGGIRIFRTEDLDDDSEQHVERVGYISPPDAEGLRTAHNFDVTDDYLHASWYNGGVRRYDVTDPSNPKAAGVYNPDGQSFWTAVASDDYTLGGIYGAGSDAHEGGVAILSSDD